MCAEYGSGTANNEIWKGSERELSGIRQIFEWMEPEGKLDLRYETVRDLG